MDSITLVFPESYGRTTCLARLTKPDSGFQVDPRASLDSGIEIGIGVAGLLLSAAQLAVAIIDLRHNRSASSQPAAAEPEVVTIVRPDGRRKSVTSDDPAVIQRELESMRSNTKPESTSS